jgi:sigma-B regulation protein RsbU (phosphoserine phosphatase)
MSVRNTRHRLSTEELEPILAVTRQLAAAFDIETMLREVVQAAETVLKAERCSVWLYDSQTDELVLHVSADLAAVRVPAGSGIVGSCARTRQTINVPDCYADARFNQELDRHSHFHTRGMLSLPLVGHRDELVGVIQVLNKVGGVFDEGDEALASALAAQCAVALQRTQMTAALIEGEKMRQQLELARAVQMHTLPLTMPEVPGYEVFGVFKPAELTGGDTFDLVLIDQGLLVVLADATGHGIAPALHVTQMHAMLRMAFRMGADLETAFMQVNNQLAAMLPDDRFITAFIGILDAARHHLRFHSGGQAPILLYQCASGQCTRYDPTSFPLAAMPLAKLRAALTLQMHPGDILVLLSDGIYEYYDGAGDEFGETRVADLIRANCRQSPKVLADLMLEAVAAFAGTAPQEDDITMVIVKRSARAAQRSFVRSIAELDSIFAFTADAFARLAIDRSLVGAVDFVIEELFTNMVKYNASSKAPIDIDIEPIEAGVEVRLIDRDVDEFDMTRVGPVDIDAPLEEREPGGLGLHLIRKMVDTITYQYSEQTRESRICFRKTVATPGRLEPSP